MTVSSQPLPPVEAEQELIDEFFDTNDIVSPESNPPYTPARLSGLLESIREHNQLVPGWVFPSPDLPPTKLYCLDGNGRLACARILGRRFWAFRLNRCVPEEELIKLIFGHNHTRRCMRYEEIAERAGRYMELTRCTQSEAARRLMVSEPTLSRAFGDRRIPAEYRPRAERLGRSVRSLIAAAPVKLMPPAFEFAETPGPSGAPPTRDQVAGFLSRLKAECKRPKTAKPRKIKLHVEGRRFEFELRPGDTPEILIEAIKNVAAQVARHRSLPMDAVLAVFGGDKDLSVA
jgi:hypothetical protein